MDIEKLREYCLSKKGVTEGFPFDETTLVFKVMNKMFALVNLEPPHSINLKCKPEKAVELREIYHWVLPGYHMNKEHWNTIELWNAEKDLLVEEWIDNSYELVVDGLPKADKEKLFMLED